MKPIWKKSAAVPFGLAESPCPLASGWFWAHQHACPCVTHFSRVFTMKPAARSPPRVSSTSLAFAIPRLKGSLIRTVVKMKLSPECFSSEAPDAFVLETQTKHEDRKCLFLCKHTISSNDIWLFLSLTWQSLPAQFFTPGRKWAPGTSLSKCRVKNVQGTSGLEAPLRLWGLDECFSLKIIYF